MKILRNQTPVTYLIWATLGVACVAGLVTQNWLVSFVAIATFGVSILPLAAASRLGIGLPRKFIAMIVLFTFGSLFLGEVLDFYERYWWWDMVLHGMSAVGFGLVGFLLVFVMFEGDKYAAPAWALGAIAACFAVTIGVLWEIFEFAMDQFFGLNMQKSGLMDTMGDLILDVIGGSLGGLTGFLYLKGRDLGGGGALIEEFIARNRRFFKRFRKR